MKTVIGKAVQIQAPNQWKFVTQTFACDNGSALARVRYSSICHTDLDILAGRLIYYRNGIAQYPITTGHEWCGYLDNQPVTAAPIIGCGECEACQMERYAHCMDRKEIGVIKANGAHADYIIIPRSHVVALPSCDIRYTLVEPMAVCVHGLKRISLGSKILVSGYGTIGRLCSHLLSHRGYSHSIYDPKLHNAAVLEQSFDTIIECSGATNALDPHLSRRGVNILLFGFSYNPLDSANITSNEITLIGTLGTTYRDCTESVELIASLNVDFTVTVPFEHFSVALDNTAKGQKTIMEHI